ncbi:MAG: hypothetical protein HEP71_00025 [Roseivirga sp.]|nr:hypothetical protein [Roseivirga sp.]
MKKTQSIWVILAMLFTVLSIASCDDNEPIPDWPIPNELVYNEQVFELSHGIVKDWNEVNNDAGDYDIALFTEGITINEAGQPENEGTIMYFNLNSFSANSLEDGKYVWSAERMPGTVTESALVVNFSDALSIPQPGVQMKEVTLHVKQDNGEFTINFILKTEDDETVTGSYVGPLTQLTED